jgi:hypothetical protein
VCVNIFMCFTLTGALLVPTLSLLPTRKQVRKKEKTSKKDAHPLDIHWPVLF